MRLSKYPEALPNNQASGQEQYQQEESFLDEDQNNFSDFDQQAQQPQATSADDSLDRELEDIGIDPKELDELEDLY